MRPSRRELCPGGRTLASSPSVAALDRGGLLSVAAGRANASAIIPLARHLRGNDLYLTSLKPASCLATWPWRSSCHEVSCQSRALVVAEAGCTEDSPRRGNRRRHLDPATRGVKRETGSRKQGTARSVDAPSVWARAFLPFWWHGPSECQEAPAPASTAT